jgi:putative FmdB family regulatory protein
LPLYEYKCEKCGHRFERIEPFSAPEITKCPDCKGKAERQLASPAIQFKGSGWYVTDYAGKGSSSSSSEGGDGKSKPASENSSAKKESSSKESASKSKNKKD